MLKVAIALVFVVGLVAATVEEFRWETIPIAENASQCIYRPEVKTLACRGPSGLVECPASLEFGSLKFDVFGLGRLEDISFTSVVWERKFALYPRKLDNQTYVSYKVVGSGLTKRGEKIERGEKKTERGTEKLARGVEANVEKKTERGVEETPVELFLYFDETRTVGEFGVRVTDKKCYERLVDIVFGSSTLKHVVPVEGTDVELFGEVLIAEKPSTKRWLGFGLPWGLGLGGLGWGMGAWGWGLGWGLPLWG